MRTIPATIDTDCISLNQAWDSFAPTLCREAPNGIAIGDDDKSLNWDAFLGRTISVGRGPEALVPSAGRPGPDLQPLRERGITLRDLAALWQIEPLRQHFMRTDESKNPAEPAAASCSVLLASGGPAGKLLCNAFESLPASSSHWSVRALLQNASLLADCEFSFRRWLERETRAFGEEEFPPRDFRKMVIASEPNGAGQYTLEVALQRVIGRVFHRANTIRAAHMICDWQLGLWLDERIQVFDLFPYDSHHRQHVETCSDLPIGADEFIAWWHAQPGCADLPPRLASACMACSVINGPVG